MTILIIETSTERGIVACVKGDHQLFSVELPFGLLNSKFLLPELDRGLKSAGIVLSELTHVVVGIGPGSYTGIRVGVIVAKALAFALNIPLIGICTLESFLPDCEGEFAAVIDAKIGGVYLQKGSLKNGQVSTLLTRQVASLAEAAILLKETRLIVTPNAASLASKLAVHAPESHWRWLERYPSAIRMAALGLEKYHSGDYSSTGHLELLYMRKTQAEIELELKKG